MIRGHSPCPESVSDFALDSCSSDWMVQMSNIFTYFTVSLPFPSHDVSIVIKKIIQMITARWRHGSHSTQTSLWCVPPEAAPWVALQEIIVDV